jgi:hypothetical protein
MPEATVNMQMATRPGHATLVGWLSFLAWMSVGAAIAFGFLSLGTFVLAPAVLIGIWLAFQRSLRRGAFGLMAGLGAILLFVAWLNRGGPGNVVTRTATSVSSTDAWDPRPWLAAGLVLVIAGVAAQLWRSRSPT